MKTSHLIATTAAALALSASAHAQVASPMTAEVRTYDYLQYLRNPRVAPLEVTGDGMLECAAGQSHSAWSTTSTRAGDHHLASCLSVKTTGRTTTYLFHQVIVDVARSAPPEDLRAPFACASQWSQLGRAGYFHLRLHPTDLACATAASSQAYYATQTDDYYTTIAKPTPPSTIAHDYRVVLYPQAGQTAQPGELGWTPDAELVIDRAADPTMYLSVVSPTDPSLGPYAPVGFWVDFMKPYASVASGCDDLTSDEVAARIYVDLADIGGWYDTAVDGQPVFAATLAVQVPMDQLFEEPLTLTKAIRPIAVRVVPVRTIATDADSWPFCAGAPTPPVRMNVLDSAWLRAWKQQLDEDLSLLPQNFWEVEVLSYAPPRFARQSDENSQYIAAVDITSGPVTLHKGEAYNADSALKAIQADKSKWKQFLDEAVNIMGAAAQAFEYAKGRIADLVATGVCVGDDACKAKASPWIKKGIAAGLAAMGVPPTLPNLRELAKGGTDYLAAMAVEEAVKATGVPADDLIVQGVSSKLKSSLEETIDGALQCAIPSPDGPGCVTETDNPYTWGNPDPFWGNRLARLYVRIKPHDWFQYNDLLSHHPEKIPPLGSLRIFDEDCVYQPMQVPVPRIFDATSATSVVIPLSLHPLYNGAIVPESPATGACAPAADFTDWFNNRFHYQGIPEDFSGICYDDTFYPKTYSHTLRVSTVYDGNTIDWTTVGGPNGYPLNAVTGMLQTNNDADYYGRIYPSDQVCATH